MKPTEAQKKAGNYPMKHVTVGGLDISVETRRGAIREGKDKDGKPWRIKMPCDYGRLTGGAAGMKEFANTPEDERRGLVKAALIGGGMAVGGGALAVGLHRSMTSGAMRTVESLRAKLSAAHAAAKASAGADRSASGIFGAMRSGAVAKAAEARKGVADAEKLAKKVAAAKKKAVREWYAKAAPNMSPNEKRAARAAKMGGAARPDKPIFRAPEGTPQTGIPIPAMGKPGGRKVRARVAQVPPAPVAAPAATPAPSKMDLIREAVKRSKNLSAKFFEQQQVTVVKQKRDTLSKVRDAAQLAGGLGVLGLSGYGAFRVHGLYKQAAKHIPGVAEAVKKAVPKVAATAEATMAATKTAAENVTKQADNIGHSTAVYSDIGRIFKWAKRTVAGGVYNIRHPRQTFQETRNAFRAGMKAGQNGVSAENRGFFRGMKSDDYIRAARPAWALSACIRGRLKEFAAEKEKMSLKRKAGVAAGLGVAGVGASLMPAAASMMKIPGRRITREALSKASKVKGLRGVFKPPAADLHAGGRMVADYLDASQEAMNRGVQGHVAGAILRHAKKNPEGFISKNIGGSFQTEHFARFRAGHKEALGHWDWEVGELYKHRAKGVVNPKSGKMKKGMSPEALAQKHEKLRKGREAAHAEINARLWKHGENESEAIRHVATKTQNADVRGYFDELAMTKARAAEGYAKKALLAPGAVAAGGAAAAASATVGRKKKKDFGAGDGAGKRKPTLGPVSGIEGGRSVKAFMVREEDGIPFTGKVAKDRYIKKIHDEDLDRRDANILRGGAAGAVAGALAGGKLGSSRAIGISSGKMALIGGGLGGASVLAIRAATKGGRDPYGERTRAAKRAELAPALAGVSAAGYLGAKKLRLFEQKKLPSAVKAGLSAGISGAALGLIPAFRRGTGIGTVLKSVAGGAAAGAAVGGGGTYVGSKILGEPRKDEGAPITKRAAVGGAIIGTSAGLAAGILAHKTRTGKIMLRRAAKTWRPAMWSERSGVLGASAIGTTAGGFIGGMHAADEGQQVDTLNAMKADRKKLFARGFARLSRLRLFQAPPPGVKPASQWRQENQPKDRAAFFRTVGGIAAAGGVNYVAYRAGKARVAGAAWERMNRANAEARAARDAARNWSSGVDWDEVFRRAGMGGSGRGTSGSYGATGTNRTGYTPPPRSRARGTA